MQPEDRDAAYLWNLVEAGRKIQEFTSGISFSEYVGHAILPSAVERQFGVLGEAARKVSASFKSEHPEIQWRQMIGLRNILAHRYYATDHAVIWQIIHEKLPPILDQVGSLIPPLPPAVDEE
jgi:uncharacterized protein with HEPN domain